MRKLNWALFVMLPVSIGMAYLLPIISGDSYRSVNHVFLVGGGLMLWTFVCGFFKLFSEGGLDWELSWWKKVLALAAIPAFFAMLLGALMFMFMALPSLSAEKPNATQADLEAIANRHMIIRYVVYGVWAYYVFSIFAFLIQRKVRRGTIAIAGGKILYPGTKITLYPWFWYEVAVFEEWMPVSLVGGEVECQDGRFRISLNSAVELDIAGAQNQGIDTISVTPYDLQKNIRRWLFQTVCFQSQQMTLGQVLGGTFTPQSTTIEGIPIHWGGKTQGRVEQ